MVYLDSAWQGLKCVKISVNSIIGFKGKCNSSLCGNRMQGLNNNGVLWKFHENWTSFLLKFNGLVNNISVMFIPTPREREKEKKNGICEKKVLTSELASAEAWRTLQPKANDDKANPPKDSRRQTGSAVWKIWPFKYLKLPVFTDMEAATFFSFWIFNHVIKF